LSKIKPELGHAPRASPRFDADGSSTDRVSVLDSAGIPKVTLMTIYG
jgi:hypothetical protein